MQKILDEAILQEAVIRLSDKSNKQVKDSKKITQTFIINAVLNPSQNKKLYEIF